MRNLSERALLTDLYELTMLQAYFLQHAHKTAVFEFFVRQLPDQRNFLVAAGLAQVVDYLTGLRFDDDDLGWLRGSRQFDAGFVDSLQDFRFTGDVDAVPEGTVVFAHEPLLRITAPLREAQLIESRVINLMHFQTMVASKAARCVNAAQGRRLIDFGLRRAHGAEAGLLSARASYIAGFDGTATTLAAPLFGIPVSGTMAHSFVQVFDHESDAFSAFAHAFPDNATLLIDTYDTEAATQQVVRVAQWLWEEEGIRIKAVRIDSGDLGAAAVRVREILDAGGCPDIGIFVSGNLDENAVQALVEQGAPIEGFGVGTRMNTSGDAPWPGCKQVFRQVDAEGLMQGDTLALQLELVPGTGLLHPVMRGGALLAALPPLDEIRLFARAQLAVLPAPLRELTTAAPYPVAVSDNLRELARQVDERQIEHSAADRARWEQDTE